VESRRAESFSDGVFAVAITVLVFNLLSLVPPAGGQLTRDALLDAWPAYAAYVVSFLTIGIMWLNHHALLAQVTKVDRTLLVLNLFLLMGVVAIPFPTALVASQLTVNSTGARLATVIYGFTMIAISVGYASMWLYVVAHQQALGARVQMAPQRLSTVRFTAGNAGYIAGTIVAAFLSPGAALIIFGLLAIYYMFEHLPQPTDEADDEAR
jgi:uncharacterized membrane protein